MKIMEYLSSSIHINLLEPPSPSDTKTEDDVSLSTVSVEDKNLTNGTKTKRKSLKFISSRVVKHWKPVYIQMIPSFIILTSLIQILVYVCETDATRKALIYDPNHRVQLWRFVTYMLLHNDLLHLVLNIVIQCLLATPLEIEQGHWRTAVVYIGGAVGGSLGASVVEPECLAGASAGVYALLISHIPNILLNYHTIKYKKCRACTVFLLAVADITFTCYHFYTVGNSGPRIGWASHSTGAIAGLFLGMMVFKGTEEWTKTIHALSFAIVVILTSLAVACNIVNLILQ